MNSFDYANLMPTPARTISSEDARPFLPLAFALDRNEFPCPQIALALDGLPLAGAEEREAARLSLRLDASLAIQGAAGQASLDEAYSLSISEKAFDIRARSAHGAFNALTTLKAALKSGLPLRPALIEDWPSLKIRGLHFTLGSGHMPTFKRLLKIIDAMAAFKFNMLVLEYDDRFPWRSHPEIVHKDAYSLIELQAIARACELRFIEAVPLLDSLGHAGQYLKHSSCARLKERPESVEEMCPSNPDTLAFMKELWTEVLAIHHASRYAHITGDEVFRLEEGFCPKCGERARKGELSKLYVEYYSKLAEWIRSQGKTPIVWGDMLLKYPEALESFPKDVLINDWAYIGIDSPFWDFKHFENNPDGVCDERRKALFGKYWGDGERHPQFPTSRLFLDHGFKVLAATAASSGECSENASLVCSLEARFANNKRFAQTISECGGEGLLATFWSDHASLESAWAGIAAAADFSWRSRDESFERFAERFAAAFLGREPSFGGELVKASELFASSAKANPLAPCFASSKARNAASSLEGAYEELLLCSQESCLIEASLHSLHREIFGAAIAGRAAQIPLEPFANASASDCVSRKTPAFKLPEGRISVCGFELLLPSVSAKGKRYIALGAEAPASCAIKLGRRVEVLAFVAGAFWASEGKGVARVEFRYEDGSKAEAGIVAGVNALDWWSAPRILPDGVCACSFRTCEGSQASFYIAPIRNPHPERKASSVEISVPSGSKTRLLILALAEIALSKSARQPDAGKELRKLSSRISALESRVFKNFSWMMREDEARKQAKRAVSSLEKDLSALTLAATPVEIIGQKN